MFSQSPSDAKKVLFVLTDGKSNRQKYKATTEAKLLKDDKVEIFTFGIGKNVNDYELVAIASQPTKTHKFRVERFDDLSSLSHLITSELYNVWPWMIRYSYIVFSQVVAVETMLLYMMHVAESAGAGEES